MLFIFSSKNLFTLLPCFALIVLTLVLILELLVEFAVIVVVRMLGMLSETAYAVEAEV